MEYILVWILIFAGATIGLLATFLIASERELRSLESNGRETADLAPGKSTDGAATSSISSDNISQSDPIACESVPATTTEQVAELQSKIAELETQLVNIQAINRELEIAGQQRDERDRKEPENLREQLAHAQTELEIYKERWFGARQSISEIMGQYSAFVSEGQGIHDGLMRLATFMLNEAPAVVWTSSANPTAALSSSPASRENTESVAPFLPADVTPSAEHTSVAPAGSSGLSPATRSGVLAVGVFMLFLGAIAAQAWRLNPAEKAEAPVLASLVTQSPEQTRGADEASSSTRLSDAESAQVQAQKSERQLPAVTPERRQNAGDLLLRKASLAQQRTNPADRRAKASQGKGAGATYAAVRTGQVYSQPDESSGAVGEVEAGMEIFVVKAHAGWLEIRSRHGRPPGFIRSEVAIPHVSN